MADSCKTCKFIIMHTGQQKELIFTCRRFPPHPILIPGRTPGTADISPQFPTMDPDRGWCGEYVKKLALSN